MPPTVGGLRLFCRDYSDFTQELPRKSLPTEPKRTEVTCLRSANLRRLVCGSSAVASNQEGLITPKSLVQIQPSQTNDGAEVPSWSRPLVVEVRRPRDRIP